MADKKNETEIRIRGIAPDVHRELKAIAKNEETNISDLLKPHLRTIRDSYPEKMRKLPEQL